MWETFKGRHFFFLFFLHRLKIRSKCKILIITESFFQEIKPGLRPQKQRKSQVIPHFLLFFNLFDICWLSRDFLIF